MDPMFMEAVEKSELPFSELTKWHNYQMPDIVPNDLQGKVVIVTGANVGIGYETAKAIASMNPAKLILACRNMAKGNEAVKTIKESTNFQNVECWLLDLAQFSSVVAFSQKFLDTGLPLDLLVSNAGVASLPTWVETSDGLEIIFQVNHLANMLLISNLYPALKKSADAKKDLEHQFPRVVVVSSGTHFWAAGPQPDDPHPVSTVLVKDSYPLRYFISKLFNVLFAKSFAKKCPAPIWICSGSPCYTKTELGTKDPSTGEPVPHKLPGGLEPKPVYEGSKNIIYISISPEAGKSPSGTYFSEMQEARTRSSTVGEVGDKFAENVWRDSISILKKYVPSSPIYDW